jgi:mono/diheme cytochrome c family protein
MTRTLILSLLLAASAAGATENSDLAARGRYLTQIGGCNDCHTAGFAVSGGHVPESEWLQGDALGWNGPWGTTYAPNLRLRLNAMTLAEWKTYAHALKSRPPMPYWALNTMSETDLEALWTFVHALGPAGQPAPAALPPGVAPIGPVVAFPAPPPAPVAKK